MVIEPQATKPMMAMTFQDLLDVTQIPKIDMTPPNPIEMIDMAAWTC